MRDFICAYFGKDWTINARGFGSAKQAEKHGLYMMPMAGCFGFAVIAENDAESGWQLRMDDSVMPDTHIVTKDNMGNYSVTERKVAQVH